MVEVLLYNTHRIQNLWEIFLNHVLDVLQSTKAALRAAAVEAVGKAIVGILAKPAVLTMHGVCPLGSTSTAQTRRWLNGQCLMHCWA
jgi:hypothetical protein